MTHWQAAGGRVRTGGTDEDWLRDKHFGSGVWGLKRLRLQLIHPEAAVLVRVTMVQSAHGTVHRYSAARQRWSVGPRAPLLVVTEVGELEVNSFSFCGEGAETSAEPGESDAGIRLTERHAPPPPHKCTALNLLSVLQPHLLRLCHLFFYRPGDYTIWPRSFGDHSTFVQRRQTTAYSRNTRNA
jgi:hypothetical protein